MEKYATILRYFENDSLADLEKLARNSEFIWQSFQEQTDQATQKIEEAFTSLVTLALRFDLTTEPHQHEPEEIELSM